MKFKAEIVLEDCKIARDQLLLVEDKDDIQKFRVFWVMSITILRTVGDVLKNEGINHSQKNVFKSLWDKKNSDPIFKKFIKYERDNIVHEYKQGIIEHTEPSYITTEDGFRLTTEDGNYLINEKDDFVRRFYDYEGSEKKASEILTEAITWWENYIIELKDILN